MRERRGDPSDTCPTARTCPPACEVSLPLRPFYSLLGAAGHAGKRSPSPRRGPPAAPGQNYPSQRTQGPPLVPPEPPEGCAGPAAGPPSGRAAAAAAAARPVALHAPGGCALLLT